MGYTKDLWTRPEKQPDGKTKRVPTARHGRGKRWLACWTDPDGNEKTKAFARKDDANDHWRDMESDRDRGDYRDPNAGKVAFGALAARWLDSVQVDPASQILWRQVHRLHVAAKFDKRRVGLIKPSEVAAFLAALSETHGPSTVSTALRIVQGVLDLAVADGELKTNPAKSAVVRRPRGAHRQIVAWPSAQVFRVIDLHPDHLRTAPLVAATTGLRQGEVFGLGAEDIDWDGGVVHVRRQVKRLGSAHVFALPKSDLTRKVPLADSVAQALRAHMARYPPISVELPWETEGGKAATHNLLWQWHDGRFVKGTSYTQEVWQPALVGAGVIPPITRDERGTRRGGSGGDRRFGMHQLRHYYASTMLAAGVSIRDVSEYLGHRSMETTMKYYAHMLPDSHDRARAALDGMLYQPRAV